MKNISRRIFCALLVAVIAVQCSVISLSAANDTYTQGAAGFIGRDILSQMPNGETLTYVYDKLYECIKNVDASVNLNNKTHYINKDELGTVTKMLSSDHPDIFWYRGYSYSYTSTGITAVYPTYTMTKDEALSAAAALDAAAEKLCAGLYGLSDYEISLSLHDRLAEAVSYEFTSNDQNAYGALVEGKAVCAGYSAAYQYLLLKMGITALTVTGNAYNAASGSYIGHAWNLVLLDGKYYLTDVTWDDQTNSGYIFHEFLNTTDEKLSKTHIPDDIYVGFLPECTSTENNYFIRNDAVMPYFDAARIAEILKKNNYKAAVFAPNGARELARDISSNITKIAAALNITGSYSYSFMFLMDEVVFKIESDFLPKNSISVNVSLPGGAALPYLAELYRGDTLIASYTVSESTLSFNALSVGTYTLKLTAENCYAESVDIAVEGNVTAAVAMHLIGDINGDGYMNPRDSIMLKHIILGTVFDDKLLSAADLDGNGYVNTKDCYLLKELMAS